MRRKRDREGLEQSADTALKDAAAIDAKLRKILPARSQGEGMVGASVSGKYLGE